MIFPLPPLKPRDAQLMVCVDRWTPTECSGSFYHLFLPEAFDFIDRADLLLKMDRLFDELNHPQAFFQPRDLPAAKQGRPSTKPRSVLSQPAHTVMRGKRATYLVRMISRQNATWQGELTVLHDKQPPVLFRSALELLRLMDGAGPNNRKKTMKESESICE